MSRSDDSMLSVPENANNLIDLLVDRLSDANHEILDADNYILELETRILILEKRLERLNKLGVDEEE